jgi:hypothetical protein
MNKVHLFIKKNRFFLISNDYAWKKLAWKLLFVESNVQAKEGLALYIRRSWLWN